MSVGDHSFLSHAFGGKLFVRATVVIFVLLLSAFAVDYFYLDYIKNNWQSISATQEQQSIANVQSRWDFYQRETLESVKRISNLPGLHSILQGQNSSDRVVYFELLKQHAVPDLFIELYDHKKQLLSWTGNRGPTTDTSRMQTQERILIDQGPIYTYFIFIAPVIVDGKVHGYVVGKRIFDVNYPINNRFINDNAFSGTFTHSLDPMPEFDFSSNVRPSNDGKTLSVELRDVNQSRLGYAYMQRPMLTGYLDEIQSVLIRIQHVILVVLFVVLFLMLQRFIKAKKSDVMYVLSSTGLLWLLRYVLKRPLQRVSELWI